MYFLVVITVLIGRAGLSSGAALEDAGSPVSGSRPLMMACSMRSRAGEVLRDLLADINHFLEEHQPFKLPGEAIDILIVRVENAELYGLQNMYMREGMSIDCNKTAMSFVLTPGIKNVRVLSDWAIKAAALQGKAEVTIDLLEVDVTGTVLAPKGARILLDGIKIVTLEGVHAKITGPMSVRSINFNRVISNILHSDTRDEVLQIAEEIALVSVQDILDKMSAHL